MLAQLDIKDPAAAALLGRPALHALLAALIDQTCTMTMLVAATGMSYSLVTHHLHRMIALGLAEVVGETPRAGRASRLYRATAQSYLIPVEWCETLPGDQLLRELREALDRQRSPKGLLLWSEDGARMRLILDEPRPDTLELWLRLRLAPAAARQFNSELESLLQHWRGQQSPSGAVYLTHVACARVAPD
jgi:DNA-binding transcriptional ArsR family regulator